MIGNDKIFFFEIDDIENIYEIARNTFVKEDYKMPALVWLNKHKMVASLNAIKNGYFEDIPEIGASIAYYINKSHPFYDGNKRMSYIILFVFLSLNLYAQKDIVSIDEGIKFIESIAESESKDKDIVVKKARQWILDHFYYDPKYLSRLTE